MPPNMQSQMHYTLGVSPNPLSNEQQARRGMRCSSSSQDQHFESLISQFGLAQSFGRGRERRGGACSSFCFSQDEQVQEWKEVRWGRSKRGQPYYTLKLASLNRPGRTATLPTSSSACTTDARPRLKPTAPKTATAREQTVGSACSL